MQFPIDHIAVIGYTSLFIFVISQIIENIQPNTDFIMNIILAVGLLSLIVYHIRKIKDNIDETSSKQQRVLRILAHSSIALSLLLTIYPSKNSTFKPYEGIALVAHIILLVTVLNGMNQIIGVALLAMFFVTASYDSTTQKLDTINSIATVGKIMLSFYFILSTISILRNIKDCQQ